MSKVGDHDFLPLFILQQLIYKTFPYREVKKIWKELYC